MRGQLKMPTLYRESMILLMDYKILTCSSNWMYGGDIIMSADVPTVLLDGKNTQSDRREVNRTVLSG